VALPNEISTVAMTGSLMDDAGNPMSGVVTLTPSAFQMISASTDTIVELQTRTLQLDQYGEFTVDLIPSDESDVIPHGIVWTLTLPGDTPATLSFTVPSDAGPTANIADYVVSAVVGIQPQYYIGYRGPKGDPGVKGDAGPSGYNDAPLVARVVALEIAPFLRRVIYNGVVYPARPAGVPAGFVEYVGPTEPTDWLTGDTWVERI
jgi:hypothetical protein